MGRWNRKLYSDLTHYLKTASVRELLDSLRVLNWLGGSEDTIWSIERELCMREGKSFACPVEYGD